MEQHICNDITELIGSTPLVRLSRYAPGLPLAGKLERQNPAGSAKDRVALYMIRDAAARGELCPGGMIIEPTSGNTGIGIAALAAALGYRAVIVMPDSMSPERVKLIGAYGAEVVLTPGAEGMVRRGEARRGAARGQPRQHHRRPVREPRQPPRALRDHRPRDMARRRGAHSRLWSPAWAPAAR